MSKIAVIKTGGKQYQVKAGDIIKVEKLKVDERQKVNFEILLTSDEDGKNLNVGTPYFDKKVEGRVIENGRGKKVKVVHYKPKTRQHKVYGHRQPYTKVEITAV